MYAEEWIPTSEIKDDCGCDEDVRTDRRCEREDVWRTDRRRWSNYDDNNTGNSQERFPQCGGRMIQIEVGRDLLAYYAAKGRKTGVSAYQAMRNVLYAERTKENYHRW